MFGGFHGWADVPDFIVMLVELTSCTGSTSEWWCCGYVLLAVAVFVFNFRRLRNGK